MTFQRLALTAGMATLALVAGLWLSLKLSAPAAPPETEATMLRAARPLSEFTLVDHRGAPAGLDSLRGRWSLVFFGFTHCPDVCPTTLSILTSAKRELADLPQPLQPQLVFVSIDPERDTAEVLSGYVEHFNSGLLGLTGELEQVRALTAELGVAFQKVPMENGGYTMDHSAAVFLLNPRAEFNGVFSAPHSPRGIASDYEKIVRYLDERP